MQELCQKKEVEEMQRKANLFKEDDKKEIARLRAKNELQTAATNIYCKVLEDANKILDEERTKD